MKACTWRASFETNESYGLCCSHEQMYCVTRGNNLRNIKQDEMVDAHCKVNVSALIMGANILRVDHQGDYCTCAESIALNMTGQNVTFIYVSG